jgi:hypothetical protein
MVENEDMVNLEIHTSVKIKETPIEFQTYENLNQMIELYKSENKQLQVKNTLVSQNEMKIKDEN